MLLNLIDQDTAANESGMFMEIRTDRAECCHGYHDAPSVPGVLYHLRGTPILFQCRSCDPRNFEAQARIDAARWLLKMPGADHRLSR